MSTQLLRLREVQQRMPRSRSTIYAEIAKGLFPRPLKIGRGSFWPESEIDGLMAAYAGGATHEELRRHCAQFHLRRLDQ